MSVSCSWNFQFSSNFEFLATLSKSKSVPSGAPPDHHQNELAVLAVLPVPATIVLTLQPQVRHQNSNPSSFAFGHSSVPSSLRVAIKCVRPSAGIPLCLGELREHWGNTRPARAFRGALATQQAPNNPGNPGSPGRPLRPPNPNVGPQGVPIWNPPNLRVLNPFLALLCPNSTILFGGGGTELNS